MAATCFVIGKVYTAALPFLVTEILFFGGAFTVYLVYRTANPAAFAAASNHLDLTRGTTLADYWSRGFLS